MQVQPGRRGRDHLRVVQNGDGPRRSRWGSAIAIALNLGAIAFVAWVGYRRSGLGGALFLAAVGVTIAYGFRHAATAASRVARRKQNKG